MTGGFVLALVLTGSAFAAAGAVPHPNPAEGSRGLQQAGGIRLPIIRHQHRPGSVQDQGLRLRSKYARHMDDNGRRRLKRDLGRRLTQDELTTWQRDTIYTTQLEVGTPPQMLEVHLDTGSADMYLYSECNSTSCSGSRQYDRHASQTFKAVGNTTSHLEFGRGYADGYWVEDTVRLVGGTVPSQRFLATVTVDDSYAGTNVSGLAGLAWPALADGDSTPFWIPLAEQWEEKMFSFHLNRVAVTEEVYEEGVSSPGGTVTFGGVDPTAFTGDIHYTELSSRDYWRIWMDNLTVNGHAFKTGDLYSTVIDTGSTLLSGPPKLVEEVYARVPGAIKSPLAEEQGFYHVPCDAKISLSLELGGKYFAIQPQDMVYEPAKDGLCLGSLVAADLGGVHWVIGDAFLKNVYTVFRYEPPAVGFAALREPAPYRPGLPNIIKKTRL